MSIIAEPLKEGGNNFPQNKIILTDGRQLDCYPLATQAPDKLDDDHLELDKTGQYLVVGRRKPSPAPQPSASAEAQRQLFFDNAFYLLAHRERILSDSRMFLCPVDVQSGLAYTGTSGFHNPILGVYLEWWQLAPDAMQTDGSGRRGLVCQLAGSPLSGSNRCSLVREDGRLDVVSLSPFNAHWSPFMKLNQRYTAAKQLYQAYTLSEVLDILRREDNGNADFSAAVDVLFMKRHIEKLNRRIEQIQNECRQWHDKYTSALTRYNADKMRQLYAEYEAFEANVSSEVSSLRQQKQALKASLKAGRLNNKAYQQQLTPLKRRISDLLLRISHFRFSKVRETFPDEADISFPMIETFVSGIHDAKM